ncbi:biotin transporter BioY [Eubacterium aggregans]|uniref:biotin transporter BioY n=1 Tax=Eubacterium aggregans TaxID=81409 RepID=UPI003F31A668
MTEKHHSSIKTKKMVLCALFVALVAIGAFIQSPVPNLDYFTIQFFFVLLAGMLLGPRLGALSIAVYVAIGLLGIPIFAAGGGPAYILHPSFGYLLGFIAATSVTGLIAGQRDSPHFKQLLIASLGGFLITYGIGLTYKYFILNFYMGTPMPLGLIAFSLDIPGDLLLCLIASLAGHPADSPPSEVCQCLIP